MVESRRYALARAVATELRERERGNLEAVGLYGSVAEGIERRHSDIDLLLVVRRGKGHRFVLREGHLVSLNRMTAKQAREEVLGSPWNLPEALSGWRTMHILYDPRGLLRSLKTRARRPRASQFDAVVRRDILAVLEDYGKLLNALESGDREEAREMAIWYTAGAAMILYCLERHVVRTGRRLFAELTAFGALGRSLRRLRYEPLPPKEAIRLARSSWDEILARARPRGIGLDLPDPGTSPGSL